MSSLNIDAIPTNSNTKEILILKEKINSLLEEEGSGWTEDNRSSVPVPHYAVWYQSLARNKYFNLLLFEVPEQAQHNFIFYITVLSIILSICSVID